jgi:hypothetical protein
VLVAVLMERSERCSLCGTAPWEWDPEQGGHKFAYEAAWESCTGCQQKALLRDDDEKPPAGSSVTLVPRRIMNHRRALQAAKQEEVPA